MDLKGSQKIAVLLLALGDKFTADVFKRMDRQEITAISKAIVDLPPCPVRRSRLFCASSISRSSRAWMWYPEEKTPPSVCLWPTWTGKPPNTSWIPLSLKPDRCLSGNWRE